MRENNHVHPSTTSFRQPAEWEPHEACWLAWPSHGDLWQNHLGPAQKEFTDLCRVIAKSEPLEILVPNPEAMVHAQNALSGLRARFHNIPFGDIWLRDTAPVFVKDSLGDISPTIFQFNGWGEKYVLPFDSEVAAKVAQTFKTPPRFFNWILEGGSIEVDGSGTGLTTRQCLLNPNRNPKKSQQEIERDLSDALGITKLLWLGDGLINDHTDGHIDTLARFVQPGVVICMRTQKSDPNFFNLEKIYEDLKGFRDVRGQPLKVISIPSPGPLYNEKNDLIPASYVNFYISNASVIVPNYGSSHDKEAVDQIAKCFPDRQTVGLSAKFILSGGGAFHCITQQQPKELK